MGLIYFAICWNTLYTSCPSFDIIQWMGKSCDLGNQPGRFYFSDSAFYKKTKNLNENK